MPLFRLLALTMLLLLVGCSQQSFEVTVTNHTKDVITIGVVKEGPPYENDLAGPGEWAVDTRLEALPPWGHPVPPGRTIDSGKVSGEFPEGTRAYLRVYRGEHSNAELIAMSEPSFGRIDVLLFPGQNVLMIEEDPGKGMAARRMPSAVPPR